MFGVKVPNLIKICFVWCSVTVYMYLVSAWFFKSWLKFMVCSQLRSPGQTVWATNNCRRNLFCITCRQLGSCLSCFLCWGRHCRSWKTQSRTTHGNAHSTQDYCKSCARCYCRPGLAFSSTLFDVSGCRSQKIDSVRGTGSAHCACAQDH